MNPKAKDQPDHQANSEPRRINASFSNLELVATLKETTERAESAEGESRFRGKQKELLGKI